MLREKLDDLIINNRSYAKFIMYVIKTKLNFFNVDKDIRDSRYNYPMFNATGKILLKNSLESIHNVDDIIKRFPI